MISNKYFLRYVVFCIILTCFMLPLASNAAIELPEPALRVSCNGTMDGKGFNGGNIPAQTAGIEYVTGRNGQAAYFSTQAHSYAKYDGGIIDQNQGAISCWVKLKESSARNPQRYLLNIGGPEQLAGGIGLVFLQKGFMTPTVKVEDLNWKKDTWHHIAYTWKQNDSDKNSPFRYDVSLYIDGLGVAGTTINVRPVPSRTITLGTYPVPEYGQPQLFELNGAIEDFRIYKNYLSPAQIATVFGLPNHVALDAKPAPIEVPRAIFKPDPATPKSLLNNHDKNTLVGEGHPAKIILVNNASPNEKLAAKELQKYLSEIVGIKIAITKNNTKNEPGLCFIIGNETAKSLDIKVPDQFKEDEIYIKNNGQYCVVTGDKPDGALNAVYTILDHLGVRWFAPGKDGEYVPSNKNVSIPVGEWLYQPFFLMRRVGTAAPFDFSSNIKRGELATWEKRNRTQFAGYSQLHKMVAPHLDKIIPEKEFHQHPEYFGMNHTGKRAVPTVNKINPCTSNPEVVKLIANKAIELLKKEPSAQYFGIEPIDGGGWCQCLDCRNLDIDPENYTDRILTLANQIAKILDKEFPGQGKGARFFAYQTYMYPPEKIQAEKNVQVELTRGTPDLIKKWAEHVQNMQRWDYNGWKTFKWGPMPFSIQPEKFKLLKDNHYNGGIYDESVASMSVLGVPFAYLSAKLMWDPDLNQESLLDDFFEKYYGKAAKLMRECYNLIEDATRLGKTSSQTFIEYQNGIRFDPMIYSPEVWEKCLAWTSEAEKLLSNDPINLRHVKTARMTYLFSDVARDAMIAQQYITEKNHPFWKYIEKERDSNTKKLLEAIKLAKELGFQKVRGNAEPSNLEAIIALWGYPLRIDISLFREIFYPTQTFQKIKQTGKWTLAFHDDFERKELGENWNIIKGNCSIKNGYLTGRGDAIYINKKFPGDQRLEFDTWVNENQSPGDLDGIISSASMSRYGESGYLFAFGTYGNNYSKINRNKMEIFKIPTPIIEPGKRHHVVCEREGKHLKWWIDGELVGEYQEPFGPLNGEYVGFYIDTIGQIDNVKVYTKQ